MAPSEGPKDPPGADPRPWRRAGGRAQDRGMDETTVVEDRIPAEVMARPSSPRCAYDPRMMPLCPRAAREGRGGDQTCRYFSVDLTDRGMEALCRSPRRNNVTVTRRYRSEERRVGKECRSR